MEWAGAVGRPLVAWRWRPPFALPPCDTGPRFGGALFGKRTDTGLTYLGAMKHRPQWTSDEQIARLRYCADAEWLVAAARDHLPALDQPGKLVTQARRNCTIHASIERYPELET